MLGAPGGRRGAKRREVGKGGGAGGFGQGVHVGDTLQVSVLPKIRSHAPSTIMEEQRR